MGRTRQNPPPKPGSPREAHEPKGREPELTKVSARGTFLFEPSGRLVKLDATRTPAAGAGVSGLETALLVAPMASWVLDINWIFPALGICLGLYMFYRGFGMLAEKRLILNTPTSKVRSASLGLVELNGLAAGPNTMYAPITSQPCYYYRTVAWQLKSSGNRKNWTKVADETMQLPFYLDDNSGRVLIDPSGAEMDIHHDFHVEYGSPLVPASFDVPGNVLSFLSRYDVNTDQRLRVEEYCIKPKNALFVLGTLRENAGAEDVARRPAKGAQGESALRLGRACPACRPDKRGGAFAHKVCRLLRRRAFPGKNCDCPDEGGNFESRRLGRGRSEPGCDSPRRLDRRGPRRKHPQSDFF